MKKFIMQDKRHFSIIFRNPHPSLDLSKATQTTKNEYCAWDGPTTYNEVIGAAVKLAQKCGEVYVFIGKEVGRLIAKYENGELV